jgi:hypothetical protein
LIAAAIEQGTGIGAEHRYERLRAVLSFAVYETDPDYFLATLETTLPPSWSWPLRQA